MDDICAKELIIVQWVIKFTFTFLLVMFPLCTSILVDLSVLIHSTKDFLQLACNM